MSNTPRTDAAKFDVAYDSTGEKQEFVVPVKLSEQLETSLAEKERELKELKEAKSNIQDMIWERDDLLKQKGELQSNLTQLQAVARGLAESEDCPNCSNVGYTIVSVSSHACDGTEELCQRNCPVEEQNQCQCQFCYDNPKSRFKSFTAYTNLPDEVKGVE